MSAQPLSTAIHQIPQAWARSAPDAVCLHEAERTLTYGGLWREIERAAHWMQAQGVRAGQRVLIVGENSAEMVVALFACSLMGAWAVGVNARLSPRELATIGEHAEPALTVYTARVSPAAAAHAEAAGALAVPLEGTAGALRYVAHPGTVSETGPLAHQVAALIYTSGTTGAPKGVMVSHRGLLHFARVSAESRSLSAHDVAYAALPLSHIFGLATVLMATLHAGASLCLRAQFDAGDVFRALEAPGISMLQGVPTMFNRILAAAPERAALKAPRLRYVYTGGAPLDPSLKRDVQAYFGLPLHHGYGITEYAGSLCITREDAPRSDCSAGHAVQDVELHIGPLDAPARAPGEPGDIHVRGPGVMLGYYRNPEQTAAAILPGGWLATGDIGYLDDDGALFISGRSKDLIIRSGFNVYPIEVEAVINAYPGVRQSAVLGVPEAGGNESVVAFVETLPGVEVDLSALGTYLRSQLAPYKRPAALLAIDAIPTTLSGKIQKQSLRARL
ncbi:acyl--CoA ligase [Verticiella sediminum]|uniref:Acyl--CoA ligase n=1 Tax=Verticiella sediminum TaxID=1247510 RepID=A0A556AYZ6_9BURK|nr:class I adenylate-forming enzyme family protein [Verticiella sediminum]TSH98116.1 acyl--CoA ligase [Verticiella sediminum]